MKKIIISVMAIVAMSWAVCPPNTIEMNATHLCVKDCGLGQNSDRTFKACAMNQLGHAVTTRQQYYAEIPGKCPMCGPGLEKLKSKKRQRSRTHGNGVTSTK